MGSQWASEPSAAAWQLGEGARGAMLMSLEQQMQLSRQSSESTHTHTRHRRGKKKEKKSFRETNERGGCPALAPNAGTCACSMWRDVF